MRDALRLSGLDPAGIFLGKAAGIVRPPRRRRGACSVVGVWVLYGATFHGPFLLVATCLAATVGLAAAGSLYGVLVRRPAGA